MSATKKRRTSERLKQELLWAALEELVSGHEEAAGVVLSLLVDAHLDLDVRPSDLTHHVFASALGKRLRQASSGINLYLRRFDLSQISLFNLLAEHLPIVSLGGRLANEVLASLVRPGEPFALLDVGVGTGQQEVALIRQLAADGRLPSLLRMVAIEPSATSLAEAERGISVAATEAGLRLEFTAAAGLAERLPEDEWRRCADAAGGVPLVVNAAFAAHHIQGTGGGGPAVARQAFFDRLRALDAAAVVLAEPHSDHLEPDLRSRFDNCYRHFGTVFRLIDRLDLEERNRSAMKLFFAREIDDIVANEERSRTELHEPSERWLARLVKAGFQPAGGFAAVEAALPKGLSIAGHDGFAAICVDREPLIAVLAAARTPLKLTLRPVTAAGASPVGVGARVVSAAAALRVRDIMETDVATVPVGASMAQAAEIVRETRASDLAVLDDDDRFVGVLSEGDLIRALLPGDGHRESPTEEFDLLVLRGHQAASQPIDPLIIRDPILLAETDDLLLVAHEMISRQIRRLPVVTDLGQLVGSVSRANLCHALLAHT